ncbi:NAD(P)H-dependent oxidoreductase [Pseudoruegeria sp. HB172150]|uniref:NAD(P)H-dependent oxidoreductase n=1 Tax=Pseudoruegeria sp. HB172150 TaxID=2721164 RepID=UPI0015565D7E|nr:NAD(P)H-dependent oxidoreductase [Pseudoruegeria sp. HB172150]
MPRVIVYYAHPGHRHSQSNAAMWKRAGQVEGITLVDLYAEYPRFHINIAKEQDRLLSHDVYVFQFPLFWYSTPSLLKEWQDLVLEHGFAYGKDGTALAGKAMQVAVTAAGPEDAYAPTGYNRYPLRDFLRPLEQTARLCCITFLTPYALHGSLKAHNKAHIEHHIAQYSNLLEGLRDGRVPLKEAAPGTLLAPDTLAGMQGV